MIRPRSRSRRAAKRRSNIGAQQPSPHRRQLPVWKKRLFPTRSEQGQFEQAYKHFAAFARLKPQDAHAHHMAGAVLAELTCYEEAIEHYRQADRFREGDADIHFNMALPWRKAGNGRRRTSGIAWQ